MKIYLLITNKGMINEDETEFYSLKGLKKWVSHLIKDQYPIDIIVFETDNKKDNRQNYIGTMDNKTFRKKNY